MNFLTVASSVATILFVLIIDKAISNLLFKPSAGTSPLIAYSLKRNSYGYKYNDKNTRLLNEWIVYEF